MFATIDDLKKNPITDAEVERIAVRAAKYFDEVMSNPQHFAVAISSAIALGDWRLFFLQRDRYSSVTAADVQRVALAVPQALQRDGRRIHSRRRTGPRARAADGRRRRHGQGLQGRRRRGSR